MNQLEKYILDSSSLRHSDGRTFWVELRRLRGCVDRLWEYWPTCVYPANRPPYPGELLRILNSFSCRNEFFVSPRREALSLLPWSNANWAQLEIVTRNLALSIDNFFDIYYPLPFKLIVDGYWERINLVKALKCLFDFCSQLNWWVLSLIPSA